MFLRMLTDSLVRRMWRKLLAAGAVWVGLSLVVALLALSLDVHDKMNLELRSFGSNIRVEPVADSVPVRIGGHEVAGSQSSATLPEESLHKLKAIFWRNNILEVCGRLWVSARAGGREIPVLGVWLDHAIPVAGGEPLVTGAREMYGHWKLDGAWPSAKRGPPAECLLGTDLAQELGLGVGQRLEVKADGRAIRPIVAGIVSTGDREDGALIAPLGLVQELAGLPGRISEADVNALTTPENKLAEKYHEDPKSLTPAEYERWFCTPYPGSVAAEVQETIPRSAARVVRRVAQTQGAVLTRMEGLMLLLAGLTLVVCCLSVTGVITAAVLERRTEVALMQAIGAHRGSVLLLFLAETGVLGLVGGLLAAVTGSLVGQWLVRVVFGGEAGLHPPLVILSPFLGLLIAWLGSLWPVWQALNQNTATVLHGN